MGDTAQRSGVGNGTPKRSFWNKVFGGIRGAFIKLSTLVKKHKKLSILIALILVVAIAGLSWWLVTQNKATTRTAGVVSEEYQKRLPELEKAAQDKPNDATARKNYAVALYATGDLKKARSEYEAAVKINDKDATAYNNLGNVYRDLGNADKAIESYRKSIEINKSSVNAYVNLANVQLYTKNDSNAAIETYKNALKNLPDNAQIQLLLGIAYEQANRIGDAKQTYQAILAKDGDNAAAKANLDRLNN